MSTKDGGAMDEALGVMTALLQHHLDWHTGKWLPTPEQEKRLIEDTRKALAARSTRSPEDERDADT